MLLNLHKKTWMDGLMLQDYDDHCGVNDKTVKVKLYCTTHINLCSSIVAHWSLVLLISGFHGV